jgi:sorbose reductase
MDYQAKTLQTLRSIKEMCSLEGKAALITGAAGGIGRSAAAAMAEMGASLALMDVPSRAADLDEVAAYLRSKFAVDCITLTGDVADPESVNSFLAQAAEHSGTLHIVFSNAGVLAPNDNQDISYENWQRLININYTGMFNVGLAAAKLMKAHGHGGSIIFTASMSGHALNRPQHGTKCNIAYSSSKAGILHLTHGLAANFVGDGIRFNSISPGYVASGIHKGMAPDRLQYLADSVPMGRFGDLDEMTGAIIFLASDLSSYCTGTDILIDGGYCLW